MRKKIASYELAGILLAVFLLGIIYNVGVQLTVLPLSSELKTFSSYEELENFLKVNSEQAKEFENLPRFPSSLFGGGEIDFTVNPKTELEYASDYSATNIQVAGVDEADIVKTDGEYLYVVSGSNIYKLKVYPPNQAELLSKIELNETYGVEIYFNDDKLAVLGSKYQYHLPYTRVEEDVSIVPSVYPEEAFVRVYDLADRAKPVLVRTVILNGTLSGSRMIGNYVYAVVNQPAVLPKENEMDSEVRLPIISGDFVQKVEATEVCYVNVSDVFYRFTTVVAINILDDIQEPAYETFLTGQTSCMYVSQDNMFLAIPHLNTFILQETGNGLREKTLLFRLRLDEEKIVVEAEGAVSGYVLNQFSMDEYNGFFRIATTTWMRDASENNLYILNMSLEIVGEIEGLAPGERIYSVRFMGDRCYLVTFKQVDPFFVIDVTNPVDPKVLGYLKIPGFSNYLHPFDENHIIGIGRQDNNLKLSLFDVSNVASPVERTKYTVHADWSDSRVLMDHKAFLFDRSRRLLALPVSINWKMKEGDKHSTEAYWQGAYVFMISLEQGFKIKGQITHHNRMDQYAGDFEITRILYIEDVIYTVSDKKVGMNSLEDLEPLGKLTLS